MRYNFKDIMDTEMYESTSLMYVVGQYPIFNNIAIDKLKELSYTGDTIESRGEGKNAVGNLMSDFGIETIDVKVSNSVDIDTFFDVINMPNMNGKWFCAVDLKSLRAKHKELIKKHMKKPNGNGILVIYSTEWKDFKDYLRNKTLITSQHSHIISLSFPNRAILSDIVISLFDKRKVKIDQKSAELFVMRLSTAYDDYGEVIDRITLGREGGNVEYDEMLELLKGTENFILDDFIERLLVPVTNTSPNANKKMYRMAHALISEFGARNLATRLQYKINDYIEFRLAINTGFIPIKVKYSISEVKARLGEQHTLYKVNDFLFKRMAFIAAKTTLADWMYMKLILNNVTNNYSNEPYEKVIYALINRTSMEEVKLNSNIGLVDLMSPDLNNLNSITYIDGKEINCLLSRRALGRMGKVDMETGEILEEEH